VRKYCQLFTHESNTFLGKQYVILTGLSVHRHTKVKMVYPLVSDGSLGRDINIP